MHIPKKDTNTTTKQVTSKAQKENSHVDEFFQDNDSRYEKEAEMLPVPVLPIIVPQHMRHTFRKTQKRSSSDDPTVSVVQDTPKKQRTKEELVPATETSPAKIDFFNDENKNPLTITESASEALELEEKQDLRSKQAQMKTKQPLTKAQWSDPMGVAEYATEIFQNLYDCEVAILPDPTYAVHQQHEVTWKMRSVLVDWVIEIHYLFQLLPETLFLTVNIIDRFLSQRTVVLGKLQLVGITALFIATKFEEMSSPTVSDFLFMTDKAVKEDELLKAERFILEVLGFRLCYPNPLNFLRRICQYDRACDVHTRTLAKYFLEIACIDHRLIGTRPSKVASAGLWLAHKMMAQGRWTGELERVSGYSANDLKSTVEAMLDYLSQPVTHQAFYKKWAARECSKASVFVRDWINRYYV